MEAAERQRADKRVCETPDSLDRNAAELETRSMARPALLARQAQLTSVPPFCADLDRAASSNAQVISGMICAAAANIGGTMPTTPIT